MRVVQRGRIDHNCEFVTHTQARPLPESATLSRRNSQTSVAQGLCHVKSGNSRLPLQVGQRPRDPEHSMIASCREFQRVDRLREQCATALVRTCDGFEEFAICLCVCSHLLAPEPMALDFARRGDAGSDFT